MNQKIVCKLSNMEKKGEGSAGKIDLRPPPPPSSVTTVRSKAFLLLSFYVFLSMLKGIWRIDQFIAVMFVVLALQKDHLFRGRGSWSICIHGLCLFIV